MVSAFRELGGIIREQREQARISLRQLARQAGVSNPYLSQIERGLRTPSAQVLQRIADALSVSTPADAAPPTDDGVVLALAADRGLTERQKIVLLDVYRSFRRDNEPRRGLVRPHPPSDPSEETP